MSADEQRGLIHINSVSSSSGDIHQGSLEAHPPKPLAWAAVRHQVVELAKESKDAEEESQKFGQSSSLLFQALSRSALQAVPTDPTASAQCQHVVQMTCLNLQHELNLRDVGEYAWVKSDRKIPHPSMIQIMKRES